MNCNGAAIGRSKSDESRAFEGPLGSSEEDASNRLPTEGVYK